MGGYYSSRKSGWQRRKEGLANDHCGSGVIGEVTSPLATPVEEEEVVEEETEKETEKETDEDLVDYSDGFE